MRNYRYILLGFILGIIFSILVQVVYPMISPTKYYQAKHDIVLRNGSVISKGSVLYKDSSMPEGNSILKLYVSGFKESINRNFIEKTDKRRGLKVLHWLVR